MGIAAIIGKILPKSFPIRARGWPMCFCLWRNEKEYGTQSQRVLLARILLETDVNVVRLFRWGAMSI